MDTDWRGAKGMKECLETLCLTERMSDVTFSFPGSEVQLRAHKFVLSLRSAVFEPMFYGPMAEQRLNIQIEDSDPESFKLFLRYIYTDATDFKGPTVLKCLYLARKYCVESLVLACSLYLETSISGDNVCVILEQADYFAMPELQEKCLLYMADNSEDILKSEEFLTISNKSLVKFLAREEINAKEECVFKAAVQWAKIQCVKSGEEESPANQRRYLGDAFFCIRLPAIPIGPFTDVISASGLLSSDEEIQLYRHIGSNKTVAVSGTVCGFKMDRRNPRLSKVVLSNDPAQANSTPGIPCDIYSRRNTKHVMITITSSKQLKLLSVSGNIFDIGIEAVFMNNTELMHGDQWRINNQKFQIIDGMLLKQDVKNLLTFVLKQIVAQFCDRSESSDILGAKCTIVYPLCQDCKVECVAIAKSE